jgi:hypothetical protein
LTHGMRQKRSKLMIRPKRSNRPNHPNNPKRLISPLTGGFQVESRENRTIACDLRKADGNGQLLPTPTESLKADEIAQTLSSPTKSDKATNARSNRTLRGEGAQGRRNRRKAAQSGQLANQTNNSDKSPTKRTIRATADHLAQPSQPALLPTKWDPHAQGWTIRTCGSRASTLSCLVRIRREVAKCPFCPSRTQLCVRRHYAEFDEIP